MTVVSCSSCSKQISLSANPGLNPEALLNPAKWATTYYRCLVCKAFVCGDCAQGESGAASLLAELTCSVCDSPVAGEAYDLLKTAHGLANNGQSAEGLKYAHRAVDAATPGSKTQAEAYVAAAFCHDLMKAPAEAEKLYAKGLEVNPEHADAWQNRGLALHKLGEYREALACYDKAIELEPKDPLPLSNKGMTYMALDQPAEARGCLEKIIELNERDAFAWLNLGHLERTQGRNAEALAAYRKFREVAGEQHKHLIPAVNRVIAQLS